MSYLGFSSLVMTMEKSTENPDRTSYKRDVCMSVFVSLCVCTCAHVIHDSTNLSESPPKSLYFRRNQKALRDIFSFPSISLCVTLPFSSSIPLFTRYSCTSFLDTTPWLPGALICHTSFSQQVSHPSIHLFNKSLLSTTTYWELC